MKLMETILRPFIFLKTPMPNEKAKENELSQARRFALESADNLLKAIQEVVAIDKTGRKP